MWVYWVMFFVPAFAAIVDTSVGYQRRRIDFAWITAWLFLTLIIGFRYRVGGDWGTYLRILYSVRGLELEQIVQRSDPGYALLNSLSLENDCDIYGVNLIAGGVFAFGLLKFCLSRVRPWLGLAVAVPYLVIVVAMGYTRQGVALGLIMAGLVALKNKSIFWFVVCVALGATFHRSAVLIFPIVALSASRNRWWTAVWVGLFALGLYKVLLEKDAELLYKNYIEAGYQSQGAAVRLLMNALPAAIFLIWRKRFRFAKSERGLWTWFSIISLLLLAVLAISPSSTAVDRVALYMLPLQVAVFAGLPDAFGSQGGLQAPRMGTSISLNSGSRLQAGTAQALILYILVFYGSVLFVWLNFAENVRYWLPYRFYPLEF